MNIEQCFIKVRTARSSQERAVFQCFCLHWIELIQCYQVENYEKQEKLPLKNRR